MLMETAMALNPNRSNLTVQPGGWKILKQTPIKRLPKRDVFNTVLISVAKAYADLNMKATSDTDRDYLVNELTDNIIKRFPAVRLSEIPDAFALGIRGKYGEFFGLNVVVFERFVEQYLLSEQRTALVKEKHEDEEPAYMPDIETQFATGKYNTLQALHRKTNSKDIEVIATSVYTFLDHLKLVTFSTGEKNDMMADAVRELINDLRLKLILANTTERPEIKRDIEALSMSITVHTPVSDRLFNLTKLRAKKLALDAFLNYIMMEDINLETLVDSRKEVFLQAMNRKSSR
jgi:hypothetical protein